jgi:hypothetical protein
MAFRFFHFDVEKTSAECNEDSYLAILHLSRVELHCKLQEKLHRVTWPLRSHAGLAKKYPKNGGVKKAN